MKSISVHGIDEETEKAIEERARNEKKSVNKVVKELITKALGLDDRPPDNRGAFSDLCGVWTEVEADEFLELIADLEAPDMKDWQ